VWKEADERGPTVGETGAPPAQDQRPPPIDHRLPLTRPHHTAAVVETWQELSTRWAGILHSGWLSHAGTVPGRHTETRKRARYRSPLGGRVRQVSAWCCVLFASGCAIPGTLLLSTLDETRVSLGCSGSSPTSQVPAAPVRSTSSPDRPEKTPTRCRRKATAGAAFPAVRVDRILAGQPRPVTSACRRQRHTVHSGSCK
jgi:hypothetical protein